MRGLKFGSAGLGLAVLLLGGLAVVRGWETTRAFRSSADELVARSIEVRERAGPAYESEALTALPPNPHNGPFYRFDERIAEAEVLEAPSSAAEEGSGVLLGLEFEGPEPGFTAWEGRSEMAVADGTLRLRQGGSDLIITSEPLAVATEDVGEIRIRARVEGASQFSLGWSDRATDTLQATEGGEDGNEAAQFNIDKLRVSVDVIGDGEFHTYVIDAKNALQRETSESDSVRALWIQALSRDALMEIDHIRLLSKASRYLERSTGADYERIGGLVRRVLHMSTPQRLAFAADIPENAPRLDFGTAVLLDGRPVRFRVLLRGEGIASTLYERRVASANDLEEARIDLSPWAGRSVRLIFEALGDGGNIAFWSDPLLSSAPTDRLNVIFVLEDALRADRLSTYGHARPTAPVKDSLMAESGVVFLNAISQATKTRPSVPSMMTGLLPTATGVWHFSDILADPYLTLPEVLRSQGFVTASFIENSNAGPGAGLHQGFGMLVDRGSIGASTEELVSDHVAEWLERWGDRNFFLYLHVIDPHGPYDPPPPYDRWYREEPPGATLVKGIYDYLDPPWVEEPTAEGRRLLYDGEIRRNDDKLPKLLASLERLGLAENTLIVFTSDHGEYLGDYDLWEHHPPGLRPVIGVPLMLHHPARFPEPRRVEEVVQLLDLMPTVLEIAGVELGGLVFQGSSLVDLAEGRAGEEWRTRMAISEEPMAMKKGRLCECGSLFFRGWQYAVSNELEDVEGRAYFGYRRALDFGKAGGEAGASFDPVRNYLLKFVYGDVIRAVQVNDIEAWKKFTSQQDRDVYRLDPEEVERLRALGYIN